MRCARCLTFGQAPFHSDYFFFFGGGGGGDFYGNFICVCTWLIYTDYSYSAGVGLLKSYNFDAIIL